MPRPVSGSGVRFAANDTPHAPLHAVSVSLVAVVHGLPLGTWFGALITMSCGWPESARSRSGTGPVGVSFFGVWQSWQPPTVTRISPLFAGSCAGAAAGAAAGGA